MNLPTTKSLKIAASAVIILVVAAAAKVVLKKSLTTAESDITNLVKIEMDLSPEPKYLKNTTLTVALINTSLQPIAGKLEIAAQGLKFSGLTGQFIPKNIGLAPNSKRTASYQATVTSQDKIALTARVKKFYWPGGIVGTKTLNIAIGAASRQKTASPLSGVCVRLNSNNPASSFSTGLSTDKVKCASLQISIINGLKDSADSAKNPEFDDSLVKKVIEARSQKPSESFHLTFTGLGSKNTSETSSTKTGVVPLKIAESFGPNGYFKYTAKDRKTSKTFDRFFINPCDAVAADWLGKFYKSAGKSLDENTKIAAVTIATGMNGALTIYPKGEIQDKLKAMGCTKEQFIENSKKILKEAKDGFKKTPLLLGVSQLGADETEFPSEQTIIAQIIDYAINELGYDGVETHALSGNVNLLNKKTFYDAITSLKPKIVIDGLDDTLIATEIGSEELEDDSLDPGLSRNLGTFTTVAQAAINKLPGVTIMRLVPHGFKIYEGDVKYYEETHSEIIGSAFDLINSTIYKP